MSLQIIGLRLLSSKFHIGNFFILGFVSMFSTFGCAGDTWTRLTCSTDSEVIFDIDTRDSGIRSVGHFDDLDSGVFDGRNILIDDPDPLSLVDGPDTLIFTPSPEWVPMVETAILYGHEALGLDWRVGEGGVPIQTGKLPEGSGGRAMGDGRCFWKKCNKRARIILNESTLTHARGQEMVAHEMFHVASAWSRKSSLGDGSGHLPETKLMDYRSGSPVLTPEDVALICSAAPCKKETNYVDAGTEENREADGGIAPEAGESL